MSYPLPPVLKIEPPKELQSDESQSPPIQDPKGISSLASLRITKTESAPLLLLFPKEDQEMISNLIKKWSLPNFYLFEAIVLEILQSITDIQLKAIKTKENSKERIVTSTEQKEKLEKVFFQTMIPFFNTVFGTTIGMSLKVSLDSTHFPSPTQIASGLKVFSEELSRVANTQKQNPKAKENKLYFDRILHLVHLLTLMVAGEDEKILLQSKIKDFVPQFTQKQSEDLLFFLKNYFSFLEKFWRFQNLQDNKIIKVDLTEQNLLFQSLKLQKKELEGLYKIYQKFLMEYFNLSQQIKNSESNVQLAAEGKFSPAEFLTLQQMPRGQTTALSNQEEFVSYLVTFTVAFTTYQTQLTNLLSLLEDLYSNEKLESPVKDVIFFCEFIKDYFKFRDIRPKESSPSLQSELVEEIGKIRNRIDSQLLHQWSMEDYTQTIDPLNLLDIIQSFEKSVEDMDPIQDLLQNIPNKHKDFLDTLSNFTLQQIDLFIVSLTNELQLLMALILSLIVANNILKFENIDITSHRLFIKLSRLEAFIEDVLAKAADLRKTKEEVLKGKTQKQKDRTSLKPQDTKLNPKDISSHEKEKRDLPKPTDPSVSSAKIGEKILIPRGIKPRKLLQIIQQAQFEVQRQRGSHKMFIHPEGNQLLFSTHNQKSGIKLGTLKSIEKSLNK